MFNREQAAHYLAAMIDGEGWVGEPKGHTNRAIRISNTDPVLIEAIIECCQVLGLHFTMTRHPGRREHWSPQETVHITGLASFQIVLSEVPVRAPAKLDRIRRTIDSYRPALDLAQMMALYNTGLTQSEVADRLGVSVKRVRGAMRRAGLKGRSGVERAEVVWRVRRERSTVSDSVLGDD